MQYNTIFIFRVWLENYLLKAILCTAFYIQNVQSLKFNIILTWNVVHTQIKNINGNKNPRFIHTLSYTYWPAVAVDIRDGVSRDMSQLCRQICYTHITFHAHNQSSTHICLHICRYIHAAPAISDVYSCAGHWSVASMYALSLFIFPIHMNDAKYISRFVQTRISQIKIQIHILLYSIHYKIYKIPWKLSIIILIEPFVCTCTYIYKISK